MCAADTPMQARSSDSVRQSVPLHQRNSAVAHSETKHRGLCWDRKHAAWRVRIFFGGKQRHIGRFKDALAAARAYDRAAYFLYGQKAVLNFSSEEAAADQGGVPLFIRHAKEQADASIAACGAESSSTVPASSSSSLSDGLAASTSCPTSSTTDADPAWQLLQQHRKQQPRPQVLEQLQPLPTHHHHQQQQQQQLCAFDTSVLPVGGPGQPAGVPALQLQCWPMNACPSQPASGPKALASVAAVTGQMGALSGTSVTCGTTSSCSSSSLLNPVQLASCGSLPGSAAGCSTMLPIAVAAAATGPMQAAPFLGAQHVSAAAAGASHGGHVVPGSTSNSSSCATIAHPGAAERQLLHQLLELQLQKQQPLQQTLTLQQQQQQQQAPASSGVQLLHVPPRPLLMQRVQQVHTGAMQQPAKLLQAPLMLNGARDSLQLQQPLPGHLQLQAPSMLAHSISTGMDGLVQAGVLGARHQQQQQQQQQQQLLLQSPAVAVAPATELHHAVNQQQQLQHYQQTVPVGVLTGVLQGGALLQM